MALYLYTFETTAGEEHTFATLSLVEAREYAIRTQTIAIENAYEWHHAEPIPEWDFREPAQHTDQEVRMTDTASPLHTDLAAELAELGRVEVTRESMIRVWERVQGVLKGERAAFAAPSQPTDQDR